MTTYSVSAAEFDLVRTKVRMQARNLDIARSVLVDGQRQVDAAAAAGVSKKLVSRAVTRIWDLVQENRRHSIPHGWHAELVALPAEAWPKVHELIRACRSRIEASPDFATQGTKSSMSAFGES